MKNKTINRNFKFSRLQGFDQLVNLVLEDSHERVYSESNGVERVPLGLYIIRGDNVYVFFSFIFKIFTFGKNKIGLGQEKMEVGNLY